MKRYSLTLSSVSLVLVLSILLGACTKTSIPYTQSGNWVTRSSFNGPNRSSAASFVIGNFAYVVGGIDQNFKRYNDTWEYDPVNDNWVQLASLPDTNATGGKTARNSGVAFATSTMGYMGTGYDGNNPMQDFWSYDPVANQWTQIADFAGGARYDAVAFSINNLGYVSTGYDGSNALKDFWSYDPGSNAWSEKVSMGGGKRSQAVAFVHGSKGYIVTGINSGTQQNDFWVYDPSQPEPTAWKQLRHITNFSTDSYDDSYTTIIRNHGAAFVIGDSAYISTGVNGNLMTYTWGYNFATDLWFEKTPFEGAAREGAVGFSVMNRGYIGLGKSSSAVFDDLREFHPNEVFNAND